MLGADLGNGFRKVRLAIKSKSSGKRGGARVITLTILFSTDEAEVGLLYIYDKSDRASISIKELNALHVGRMRYAPNLPAGEGLFLLS